MKTKIFLRYFLLVMLMTILPYSNTNAQHTFSNQYDLNEGMAPGWINAICQDSLGFTWIGARNGLSRFDGRNFYSYYADLNDSTTLLASEIFDIATIPNGDAWIATARGLSYYSKSKNNFENWSTDQGLTMEVCKKVAIQNDSIIWVGHWYGLDRINTKRKTVEYFFPVDTSSDRRLMHRSPNHITALKISPYDGMPYASQMHTISRFNDETHKLEKVIDISNHSGTRISDFHWIDKSNLIITQLNSPGVFIYNLKTKKIREKKYEGVTAFRGISELNDGRVFLIEKHNGPILFENSARTEIIRKDSTLLLLGDLTFFSIHCDPTGRIWTGTQRSLLLFEENKTKSFDSKVKNFYDSAYDRKLQYAITTGYNGASSWKYESGNFEELDYKIPEIPNQTILYSNNKKRFLGLLDDEIILFHPVDNRVERIKLSKKISSQELRTLKQYDNHLIASIGSQIQKIDLDGTVTDLLDFDKRIIDLIQRKDGSIFFSCYGTFYLLKDGQVSAVKHLYDVIDARGFQITGDTSLWYVQWHKGLVELDLRNDSYTEHVYGPTYGLQSQIFHGIYLENDKFLMPGSFIINVFDPVTKRVIGEYGKRDKSAQKNLDGAVRMADSSYLFIPTLKGILLFPKNQIENKISHLELSHLTINNTTDIYDLGQPIELAHNQNDLTLHLLSTFYGSKDQITYSYKLKEDSEWNDLGSLAEVSLANLRPGTYNLSIKAQTIEGQTDQVNNTLKIKINPPWWKTWWFKILSIVALLSLTFWGFRTRINNLKSKHEIEKTIIKLEQLALKSQMNPHFLFNCLNGIRTLISLKEEDQAINYVNYLSKLLRGSLQYSNEPFISMDKELEMIENYLVLAKLRFGEKINWAIHIDPSISVEKIMIPPFLLQPLLENAVWHGIKHLEGVGHIEIRINASDKAYIVKIIDNGVGLTKAAEIQKSKLRTRKHIGLELVRKRLEMIDGTFALSPNKNGQGVEAKITLKK